MVDIFMKMNSRGYIFYIFMVDISKLSSYSGKRNIEKGVIKTDKKYENLANKKK